MAIVFAKAKSTINEHIKNVFAEGELDEKVAVRKFRITTQHGAMVGKTQELEVNGYNLDVVISVGYRVKSPQGTQFRIWATQRLKEYIIKGFVLNDNRFKSGSSMNFLMSLRTVSGRSDSPISFSIRKSRRSIPPTLIMHPKMKRPSCFSRWCRTSFCGPSASKQRPSWSIAGLIYGGHYTGCLQLEMVRQLF